MPLPSSLQEVRIAATNRSSIWCRDGKNALKNFLAGKNLRTAEFQRFGPIYQFTPLRPEPFRPPLSTANRLS